MRLLLSITMLVTMLVSLQTPQGEQPSQGDAVVATVGASLCPRQVDPESGLLDLSYCVGAVGMSILATSENGSDVGSCVTGGDLSTPENGHYASCEIALPGDLPEDTYVYFSVDLSTVPDGYQGTSDPLGASIGSIRDSSDMAIRFDHFPVEAHSTDALAADPAHQPRQSTTRTSLETTGSRAAINAGTCDEASWGTLGIDLTDVRTVAGADVGPQGVADVQSSVTQIEPGIDELTSSRHVVAVFDEDDPTVMLACGQIGGHLAKDGSLVIGLRAVNQSRYSGLAILTPGKDKTTVTIYLVEQRSAQSPVGVVPDQSLRSA